MSVVIRRVFVECAPVCVPTKQRESVGNAGFEFCDCDVRVVQGTILGKGCFLALFMWPACRRSLLMMYG